MRQSRTQTTRAAEDVHEFQNWGSQALLDTTNIPARGGFVQRWVRTSLDNKEDQNNVFKKINQGWKPRPLSSVPKGQYVPNIDFQGTDVIGIHGMILMERPVDIHNKHKRYVQNQTQLQTEAVKNDVRKVHEPGSGVSAPTYSNKSNVSKGRIAPVADD